MERTGNRFKKHVISFVVKIFPFSLLLLSSVIIIEKNLLQQSLIMMARGNQAGWTKVRFIDNLLEKIILGNSKTIDDS